MAPVRILEVTHYMPPHSGGIERVAAALVEGLSRRGHEVRWIASATPERPAARDGRIRVGALNALEDRLGVPYPIWTPGGLARLAAEVRRADVVHVHDCLYMGSAAAVTAARALGKPVLVTQHVGYVPFGRALDAVQRSAYLTLGRAVLAGADRRVACSAHVPAYFASLGFRGEFEVIPNAIDESLFHPPTAEERARARAAWGLGERRSPEERVVLFVGRLVPKKGISRVAAAHRSLAAEGITLLVVGDGPLAHEIEGLPGLVHHPSVPPERMPELYRAADAFLLPSAGEGLPLSVQEAMMTGLPVVVSTDPAYRANLADAPGVAFVDGDEEIPDAVRHALTGGPRPDTAEWARARWGGPGFVDAYERVLGGLARSARGAAHDGA